VLRGDDGEAYTDVVACSLVREHREIDCGKPCRSTGVAPFGTVHYPESAGTRGLRARGEGMLGKVWRAGGFLAALVVLCAAPVRAEEGGGGVRAGGGIPTQHLTVPADVALASLMNLSDGYLRRFADEFTLLAACDQARTADWEVIRGPLAVVADANANIAALVWFRSPTAATGRWRRARPRGISPPGSTSLASSRARR
jgi:hypothetical protein